jgi:hypothetical protein
MRLLHLAIALATLSCGPDFDRSISSIPADTILAVRAEPPESMPGASVAYTALAATGGGADASAEIVWSFCTTAPAPAEDSPVSVSCVVGEADGAAVGTSVTLQTPNDACRRFGPLGMPAQTGTVPSRPTPPDATGGFYQPIRLGSDASVSIVRERLTCDPTGISLDLAQAYRAVRKPNSNPWLLPLVATVAGQPADLGALPPLAIVDLVATWPADSAEEYVTVDPERAVLDSHIEKLWVAWFATSGSLDSDISQAAPSESTVSNHFHAPAGAGTFYLWTILHDDRGGTDFAQTEIAVR